MLADAQKTVYVYFKSMKENSHLSCWHILYCPQDFFFLFDFKWLPKPHSLKHTLDISASHVIASYISVLLLHKTAHHCSAPS